MVPMNNGGRWTCYSGGYVPNNGNGRMFMGGNGGPPVSAYGRGQNPNQCGCAFPESCQHAGRNGAYWEHRSSSLNFTSDSYHFHFGAPGQYQVNLSVSHHVRHEEERRNVASVPKAPATQNGYDVCGRLPLGWGQSSGAATCPSPSSSRSATPFVTCEGPASGRQESGVSYPLSLITEEDSG